MRILSDYSLSCLEPAAATEGNAPRQFVDEARFDALLLRLQSVIDVPGLWSTIQFVVNEVAANDACILSLNTTMLTTLKACKLREWMQLRHERELPLGLGLVTVRPRVLQLSDVLFDPRQLDHAEFFRRYMAPSRWHHITRVIFWENDKLNAEIAITRTAQQGKFRDHEIAALNRLHPHIEATLHRMVALEKRAVILACPESSETKRAKRSLLPRMSEASQQVQRYSPFEGESLTPAESQLVQLLHAGLSNKEIANRLEKSVRTVKTQLTSIYRKYGVRTRTRLVATMMGAAGYPFPNPNDS